MSEDERIRNPKFSRHIEDFDCGQCGVRVTGDGYTNHCPSCLWSRHVDISPGDRANDCKALMKPIAADIFHDQKRVYHQCTKCQEVVVTRTSAGDNDELFLQLIGQPAPDRKKR